jgi:hypothetical protein
MLTGCQDTKAIVSSTSTPLPSDNFALKVNNIKFEVTSFVIKYEDSTKSDSEYIIENFDGNGIINATGDENLVKKPYSVLIEIKKISGGSKSVYNEGFRTVIVNNGIGTFTTNDSLYAKSVPRMVKPIYEINVIGYQPFIEQSVNK